MAWYVYTQECKHKKSRIQAAMEHRRSRLIKNGVTQWLRVADDMSAMRKQMAVQQQTKVTLTIRLMPYTEIRKMDDFSYVLCMELCIQWHS